MDRKSLKRKINIPRSSSMKEQEYKGFLEDSFDLILQTGQYLAPDEDINDLELAHLIPDVPDTVLVAYVGINDAACSKALVTSLLPQHGHNIVFVFDPQTHPGNSDVPSGTIDVRKVLPGFEPPNKTWHDDWTYVMIEDPSRSFQSLWQEAGYVDMIPAKFEDFTVLTDSELSKVCTFISPKAFDHPVNKSRDYLKAARKRGEQMIDQFIMPELIKDEFDGLIPVVLNKGEKIILHNSGDTRLDFTFLEDAAHGFRDLDAQLGAQRGVKIRKRFVEEERFGRAHHRARQPKKTAYRRISGFV